MSISKFEDEECWTYIEEFPRYMISKTGQVYDDKNKRYLVSYLDGGYPCVILNSKCRRIHRLLAQTFIDNPDNLPLVDHIDRNRANHELTNLRWVTHRENALNREQQVVRGRAVSQYTLDGELVAHYISYADAAKQTGYNADNISKACRTDKVFRGYKWRPYLPEGVKDAKWVSLNKHPIHPDVEVSDVGHIRRGNTYYRFHYNASGYLCITLQGVNKVDKTYLVHRLIMHGFHGPSELSVNHKNDERDDNRLCNLEYATASQQSKQAWSSGKHKTTSYITSKPVLQLDAEGNILREFKNTTDAAASIGCGASSVSKACRGKMSSIKGCFVKFRNEDKHVFKFKPRGKPVEQIDGDGNVIACFKNIRCAAINTGVNRSCISSVCLGKRPRAGGYIWRYVVS